MASMLDLLKTIVGLAQARRGLRLADREFERMHEAQDAVDRDLARLSTEYDTPEADEPPKRFAAYNEWARRRLAELEEKERAELEEHRRHRQPPSE
jgi:hypothetical protein